ncbi:hypothetical protein RclHR1_04970007 [Rhizophagus clarus]|uniref:TLDc domain-containing protein n=1 Tax=Rhizophagus clarus TaxID=94130 RepID=A0A2Z6RQ79_9GLOM|nr:hypothetical protein RclHR1_04970007 [Rhizophagus clarus]
MCYRSPFLRRTLTSNKKNDNDALTHVKLTNISPEIFQIILNSEPNDNILLPRYEGIIDSKIVNLNIASLISRWIGKINITSKFAYITEFYLPYEFKLLLRGSRDGFTPKTFHELCDNIFHTVTFIKIKGTEEIIGGYNPLKWNSSIIIDGEFGKAKNSFIFSFKSKNNFKDAILSRVKNMNQALFYHTERVLHLI